MDIVSIKNNLGESWTAVTECMKSTLGSDISLLNAVNESILSHSGKQLRPMLALMFAKACSGGEVSEATIRYAASVELLHNATLLHDDVADNSDQRRGVPTLKSFMGSSVAVLVGDYWLVKSLDIILRDNPKDSRVMKMVSKTLGDLAEGEVLQLQKAQKCDTDEKDYLRIIYSKTASLFEASCVSAVLSVSDSEEHLKAARDYAIALGTAFQIKDDILDYEGTESVGKPLGVDILEQKITIPLLGAMKNAGPDQEARIRLLVQDIAGHPENKDEVVAFVKANGGLEYAVAELDRYVDIAVKALEVLPDSYERKCLEELAYFTAKRNN